MFSTSSQGYPPPPRSRRRRRAAAHKCQDSTPEVCVAVVAHGDEVKRLQQWEEHVLAAQCEGVTREECGRGDGTGEGPVESEGAEAHGEGDAQEDGLRYAGVDEVEAGEAAHSLG